LRGGGVSPALYPRRDGKLIVTVPHGEKDMLRRVMWTAPIVPPGQHPGPFNTVFPGITTRPQGAPFSPAAHIFGNTACGVVCHGSKQGIVLGKKLWIA